MLYCNKYFTSVINVNTTLINKCKKKQKNKTN